MYGPGEPGPSHRKHPHFEEVCDQHHVAWLPNWLDISSNLHNDDRYEAIRNLCWRLSIRRLHTKPRNELPPHRHQPKNDSTKRLRSAISCVFILLRLINIIVTYSHYVSFNISSLCGASANIARQAATVKFQPVTLNLQRFDRSNRIPLSQITGGPVQDPSEPHASVAIFTNATLRSLHPRTARCFRIHENRVYQLLIAQVTKFTTVPIGWTRPLLVG